MRDNIFVDSFTGRKRRFRKHFIFVGLLLERLSQSNIQSLVNKRNGNNFQGHLLRCQEHLQDLSHFPLGSTLF